MKDNKKRRAYTMLIVSCLIAWFICVGFIWFHEGANIPLVKHYIPIAIGAILGIGLCMIKYV